jgi:heme A synthase
LGYNVAVVIWGAFVRASGSGAGCGNQWPRCDAILSPTIKTIIEFIHRSTSGVDLVLVAILLIWAFRAFPRGHAVRRGAVLSAVFLMMEALIGAALVLLEHVGSNASANRAWSLSTHLINTLTLLACLTLTAWWAGGHPPIPPRGRIAWIAGIGLFAVMLTGVTGAIAALADTLFPSTSLAGSIARDFDASANIFLRLRALHPAIAAATAAWLLFYAISSTSRARLPLILLVVAQVAAGVTNLLLLAPVGMQLLHLFLADALWITLVLCAASEAPSGAGILARSRLSAGLHSSNNPVIAP